MAPGVSVSGMKDIPAKHGPISIRRARRQSRRGSEKDVLEIINVKKGQEEHKAGEYYPKRLSPAPL
jgi:hypothetical protein